MKRNNNYFLPFLVLFLMLSVISYAETEDKLTVYTSVYPLYDVTSKIAGEKADIKLVVPNGSELHGYEPSPKKIAGLQKADIFFYVGVGLEHWADKVIENLKNESIKIVRVSKNLDLIKFGEEGLEHNEDHDNIEDGHYYHGTFDPHVWVDPGNMNIIAETIKDELIKLDPENKGYYKGNFKEFTSKIDKLDTKYRGALKNKKHQYILVSHSSFAYLARSYGFKQLSVKGLSAHAEPSPKNIVRLVDIAKDYGLRYVLMETLTSPRVVNVLADEADLEILTLNPVAGLTEEEKENGVDYFSIMEKNLVSLKKALLY